VILLYRVVWNRGSSPVSRDLPIEADRRGEERAYARRQSRRVAHAALASPDVAVDALFGQAGVIRVDTLEDLLATAMVLAHQPLPQGRRVAIVSNAGGPGILAADSCVGAGLEILELSAPTQEQLRSFVADDASVRNPIDLVAGATAGDFERTLRVVLDDPEVDALLVIFTPPLVTRADDVADAIAAVAAAGDKPIVACSSGVGRARGPARSGAPDRSIVRLPRGGRSRSGAADLADWRRRPQGAVPRLTTSTSGAHVRSSARRSPRVVTAWLNAETAQELLTCFGIPVAPVRLVTTADAALEAAADLGFPVALKAAAPNLVHKSDVGGVVLDLHDAASVRDAFTAMSTRLAGTMTGAIVQRMSAPGTETIVGSTQDPLFGPLVLFGMGGVTAELLADHALRIVPLTDEDAREQVRSLRLAAAVRLPRAHR
jgi:acyl-CoA synthetase (NDP forming)